MKSWMAVPIVAAACAGLALVLGARWEVVAAAGAGAAIVHALRGLAGNGPAALVGAGAAALLSVALVIDLPGSQLRSLLSIACAAWTIAELVRPSAAPYVALAPAIGAALLEPGYVALIAIAGVGVVRTATAAPTQSANEPSTRHAVGRRSRIAVPMVGVRIAVPILGACAVILAIVAGVADGGVFGALADRWFCESRGISDHTLWRVGDALGPLVVVAAIAGLGTLARIHLASLAIVACAAGALLVDLRAGMPTGATSGIAALCAGAGIGRLAGMIRIRSGQAIAAATFGFVLLAPAVIEQALR